MHVDISQLLSTLLGARFYLGGVHLLSNLDVGISTLVA
jgi:hypothetical protein